MGKQRQALGKGLGALIPGADDETLVSEAEPQADVGTTVLERGLRWEPHVAHFIERWIGSRRM